MPAEGVLSVRLLLDTHALLWWQTANSRLSLTALAAIAAAETEILVSSASAWDIANKTCAGKRDSIPGAAARFGELIAADGLIHLPISHRHALRAGSRPVLHQDPFDRMLAAQAALEEIYLVTADPVFADFGTRVHW